MDKERTVSVRKMAAGLLFAVAGIIYVGFTDTGKNFREFPLSGQSTLIEAGSASEVTSDYRVTRLIDDGSEGSEEPVITPLLININEAGADELTLLPGIGEKKAEAIIEYRTSNGDFDTCEDIMQVPGIKDGVYSKIKEYIYVNEEDDNAQEDSGSGRRETDSEGTEIQP